MGGDSYSTKHSSARPRVYTAAAAAATGKFGEYSTAADRNDPVRRPHVRRTVCVMEGAQMMPNIPSSVSATGTSVSSVPGGAAAWRPLPPGFFTEPATKVFQGKQASAMNNDSSRIRSPHVVRVVAVIVGLVLAAVVGAPWLLNDAPPSPEAVVATKVLRASAATPATPATRPVSAIAPVH
jgi:hypothetical protein